MLLIQPDIQNPLFVICFGYKSWYFQGQRWDSKVLEPSLVLHSSPVDHLNPDKQGDSCPKAETQVLVAIQCYLVMFL